MATYSYAAVTNIPSNYHTADLRSHFSTLVESSSFICFHFRHRPEKAVDQRIPHPKDIKRCCIVKVIAAKLQQFLDYDGHHWTDANGDYSVALCNVSPVKLKINDVGKNDSETLEEKLLQMPELRPPELMPKGNVGTPTSVFLELIQQCRLPHKLIHKLQLKFPKTAAKRIYAGVSFDYGTPEGDNSESDSKGNRCKIFKDGEKQSEKHTSPEETKGAESLNTYKQERKERESCLLEQTSTDIKRLHSVNESVDSVRVLIKSPQDVQRTFHSEKQILILAYEAKTLKDSTTEQNLSADSSKVHEPGGTAAFGTPQRSLVGSHGKDCLHSDTFLAPEPVSDGGKSSQRLSNKERKHLEKVEKRKTRALMAERIEEKLIEIEKRYYNDEDAEEWDHNEASEDDPSNQERNKERLYEEEIELPWEKGGPGVVFYTDAAYWQEKEGDFDEQTTDDLDVDFSAYEEPGAGDKDIKDFLKIRQEKRFRSGYDSTDRFSIGIASSQISVRQNGASSKIGAFECYSKGIGRKVMEKQGWKDGQGLGSSRPGIIEALKGEGQMPNNKKGLGFIEERAAIFAVRKDNRAKANHITTVYDNPRVTDPKEPLLERSGPYTLKHRQSHLDQF